MRVHYKCSSCNHENRLKTDTSTRVEFAMKNGKNKELTCVNCNQIEFLKVNNVYAKESKIIFIISGIIFLFGSAIGIYFVIKMISEMKTVIGIFIIASGLLIPVTIFSILNKEEQNRVKTFNQTYVSD